MALETANKKIWFPDDTGGTLVEAEVSDVVDNIFVFTSDTSSTSKVKRILEDPSVYKTIYLNPTLSDHTSLVNQILSLSLIKTLEISSPITLTGTVTVPTGKVLSFRKGGYVNGTGRITGGAIISSDRIKIFDDALYVDSLENDTVFLHWWLADDHQNGDISLLKAFDSQLRPNIDATGLDIYLGNVGKPTYFSPKPYVRIDFSNSTLHLKPGLYFNNVLYFDRIANLIIEGEFNIDGHYNSNPTLGAKWTETFLGAEYIPECQLGPSDNITLLPSYSGSLGGVSVSAIHANPLFLTTFQYLPSAVVNSWKFHFKPQGSPTGATKVMSVYPVDGSKKLFDVSFPASYEGKYCYAQLTWSYGGTFNSSYLMLFKEGNVYVGEGDPNYVINVMSPFDLNSPVGNGFNHIAGSRFSVTGGYTINNVPLGFMAIRSTQPYNHGYQFVSMGYSRNSSGIGNQRSVNFYDKRISEPSITGVYENIDIREIYMSDPKGLDEQLTPADGNAGEFASRAFTTGFGVVGNDLIRTEAGNGTTRNVHIGKVHASYWLSSVLGFRGVDNVIIDEIIIDHFGCKPGVVTAYDAPKFDVTNPYPYINEKFINLFKINDFDNLSQPLNSAPLRIQIGTYIVRNTSRWLLFNKTTELIAINPATGVRSVSINRFDTDMDLEGGSGQGYAGSLAGAIDINILRLFVGADARILLNVDELHFMEPSPFTGSTMGSMQGRVGAAYQWYDSQLRLTLGGQLTTPDYSDTSNKLVDTAQVFALEVNKGRFLNAEVNSIYTMSSAWASTSPGVILRIKLQDVKGLMFAPFLNHIGPGGTGVVWGINEWETNYAAVEAAWAAAKDYYDIEIIDCDLKTGGAWEKIFTANAFTPSRGRVRIFDTKDLSKTASWNYPNKQSVIRNTVFDIGGVKYTLDNSEKDTIGVVENLTELRNSQNIHVSERILVKSTNVLYHSDRTDTTTSDDGDICIVTPSQGLRWKKISFGASVVPIIATLSSNGSITIPAGYVLTRLQVRPNDNCYPGDMKIGYTAGSDEIESDLGLSGNQYGIYPLNLTTEFGSQQIFFNSPTWWGGGRTLSIKAVIESL